MGAVSANDGERMGSRGELRWLLASSLEVATEYQRPLKRHRVRRIVAAFDPDAFGMLTVSARPDGRLVIIDGQHRWVAINEMGWSDQLLPCLVYADLTVEQEARIFWKPQAPQNRSSLTAMERFVARLFEGEERAVRIRSIVDESGYKLVPYGGGDTWGGIYAVGALETIVTQGRPQRTPESDPGDETLRTVLGIARDAWGLDRPGPSGVLIDGIARFLTRYREHAVDVKRLVRVLQDVTEGQVVAEGKEQARVLRMQTSAGVARLISQRYNSRLTSARLPDWESA